MASVCFLRDGAPFTGETLRGAPLGGVETCVVELAEALARRGHRVSVFGEHSSSSEHYNVAYHPIAEIGRNRFDLTVAVSTPMLIRPGMSEKYALWLHNPANYMRKPRHIIPYIKYRPTVIFLGGYHRSTWLRWIPLFHSRIIENGVGDVFIAGSVADIPPPPKAIYFSNPRRGLKWLVDLWAHRIHPAAPVAELHIYAGRATYSLAADDKLDDALLFAGQYGNCGVVLHEPLPKIALAEQIAASRVMIYRGDLGETYCLAAAECTALGVPVITAGIGALKERVEDGVTGAVTQGDDDFVKKTLEVLKTDALWVSWHKNSLARRGELTWDRRAELWEAEFSLR